MIAVNSEYATVYNTQSEEIKKKVLVTYVWISLNEYLGNCLYLFLDKFVASYLKNNIFLRNKFYL